MYAYIPRTGTIGCEQYQTNVGKWLPKVAYEKKSEFCWNFFYFVHDSKKFQANNKLIL